MIIYLGGVLVNVLQNLVTLYNQLPLDNTYRTVVQGILNHLDEMPEATMYDVADFTNASRTTVWRTVQRMGYSSYTEFHTALKIALTQYHYYNRLIPATQCKTTEDLLRATINNLRNTTELAASTLSVQQIDQTVELLHQAKRISFYYHALISSTTSLMINLAMDGKQTGCFYLYPDMYTDVQSLDENSLIFARTLEYAETMDLDPIFALAKARGATVFLSNSNSRYLKYADFSLQIPNQPQRNSSPPLVFDHFLLAVSECYRQKYID